MMKFEINTDSIAVDIDKEKFNSEPDFSKITISKGYFGLFSPIKFYTEFVIQAISLEKSNQINSPIGVPQKLGLQLTCTTTDDPNCVEDEEPDLGLFIDSCSLYQDTLTTENSCINFCSGNGWEKCTCSSINSNSQMLLKNDNKTLCRPLDYINFAKMVPKTISGLSSAQSSQKCTLQFWMFAYSYSPNGFKGITFNWKGHNKIQLHTCSDYKCKFTCYQQSTSGQTLTIEEIKIQQWVFLSCAVDYDNKIMYLNATTQDNENFKKAHTNVIGGISLSTSELTISDDSTSAEWGILFFRQIRLWKNAFFNPEFLSRVLIETPSKFPDLLHSWEPVYNGKMVTDYPGNNLKVVDIVDSSKEFIVYYGPSNLLNNNYGMNVIDESYYSILTMCSEDGLYYDVTLKKCMQFLDLSKMNDFTFKDLPSGYSGNYAMAFWVFFEQADLYQNDGLHINWSRHLEITIQVKDYLNGYCLPQGYYTDYESNNDPDFLAKYNAALNKVDLRLLPEGLSEDGNWIWVICSVSYYKRKFYIMGNYGDKKELEINSEVLNPTDNTKTSYPMRFYLSDLNNNNMYKSKLSVTNINENKKLYLREILLFRNYIPSWYAEKIKYMNMKDLSDNQLPALAFVANFADFDLDTKKLKYYIYERSYGATTYEKVESSLLLTVRNAGSTFELSANFNFQSLCDLSTNNPNKYDPENKLCVTINNCNLQDLKALYCMDEYVPLACQAGSLISLVDIELNDGTTIKRINCTSQCYTEEFITPGTPKDITAKSMICGDEADGTKNFRIGYKCIEANYNEKSALFFSKCYNSPNFYRTISTNTINRLSSGYFYEFWIKFDNQLVGEATCKEAGKDSKEYFLYSTPHSIYNDTTTDVFYYQIINSAYKKTIETLSIEYWNKIVIETKIETTGQNVYVYINFEKDPITIANIDTSITMRLQYISFCSRKSNGDCIPGSSNIMWGSAYYRNIRVWDIKSSSLQTIQDFNNERFKDIPKSLVLYYPLTIQYIDNNVIKEIISGEDSISVKHLRSNNFQTDDDVINYNYELNLDWNLKHQCVTQPDQVLVNDKCKSYTGKYMYVPTSPAVSFKIDALANLKTFTFCIYMKFIGVLKSGTSAQPIIFSFKDDTFLVYDIATSYAIFYIGGYQKEAFRDSKFHDYIGVWTPICIANLISDYPYVHPNMFTLSINKIDIPFTSGFSLPKDGVKFSRIAIGDEIIAYFSQFRVYNKFIQGNFGTLASQNKRDDPNILELSYSLTCDDSGSVGDIFTDSTNPNCIGDYNIYEDISKQTPDDTYYFDTNLDTGTTYDSCDNDYCKTLCFNSKNTECTCKMTDTVYWLRKNKASKTYCEHPPYIDYSLFDNVSITVPSSSTNESSLEFWFYIYSYNTTNVNFKEINIIWDKHNRIQLINERNSLSARCYALVILLNLLT